MIRRPGLERVAVALDTPEWERFVELCELFGPRVGVLKVGLEAYTRWGPAAVAEARRHDADVFLDLKLHDIPSTVAGAVSAACDQGVDYLTLHAAGGSAMLEAAAAAARERVKLLAVTLLTHLDEDALAVLDLPGAGATRAARWATLAWQAGCHGAVCSPHEVAALRAAIAPPFLLVTPGIRLGGAVVDDDQARVGDPRTTLASGSDLLVVGRPLTQAEDRRAALVLWAAEISGSSPPESGSALNRGGRSRR
ncbi:MAG: orotidine-5'-phosphate decarboxylase [Acidobacteria bacterium]|nr:orotidine-5'-phosphate decarboxylase [Acidobacteriota bacterium]